MTGAGIVRMIRRHRRRGNWIALALVLVTTTTAVTSTPAVADTGDDWGPAVPGEFIVSLEPGTDAAALNLAVDGLAAPEPLRAGDALHLFRLDPSIPVGVGVELLLQQDGVGDAQPNITSGLPEYFGGRRLFWADHEPPVITTAAGYRVSQPALGHAGLPAVGATGRGVTVAVLDTGIDATHPDLASRIAAGGYDVVDRDRTPAEVANGIDDNVNGETDEAFGHGTYVAGIVRLVAPHARILPIRIIDSDGTTDAWKILRGVDLAVARGAQVVNMSLGGLGLGELVERRLEGWSEAGIVLVAAAGNENTSDLRYPAAGPGVLAVTAIDGRTGLKATFANSGSWIDVAAPGVRVVSTFPAGRHAVWGGTSASAPVAAGAAALVVQAMGTGADTDDVVDRLTATAVSDGLSGLSAYGRIDVRAAVTRALAG
jgi:thermitase